MRPISYPLLVLPLLFAGCGGSGTANGPLPFMATGFANAQTDYAAPYRFSDDEVAVINVAEDGTTTAETITLGLQGTPLSGPIRVSFDGEVYTLTRADDNAIVSFADGNTQVLSFPLFNAGNTGAYYIERFDDGDFTSGYFVFGHDTDPADVARRSGVATYNGGAALTLRSGNRAGFGVGDVALDVNFGQQTIGGDIRINSTGNPAGNITFPNMIFTLDDTAITQNGFRGTTSARSVLDAETFSNGRYFGRFYDDDAASAGGQFTGQVSVPALNATFLYEGVFIGTQ